MSAAIRVTDLIRYPVKGLGAEAPPRVALRVGEAMPGDRVFAIAHGRAPETAASGAWEDCASFVHPTHSPKLAQITLSRRADDRLRFEHPEAGAIDVALETDADRARLVAWATPLIAAATPGPYRLVAADAGVSYGDDPAMCVSIMSHASRRALEERAGAALAAHRFRGNIWIDGAAPWEEFEWIGRELAIGAARLKVFDRIPRCMATAADPASGRRDVLPTRVLEAAYAHTDFGVLAEVIAPGEVALDAEVSLAA